MFSSMTITNCPKPAGPAEQLGSSVARGSCGSGLTVLGSAGWVQGEKGSEAEIRAIGFTQTTES